MHRSQGIESRRASPVIRRPDLATRPNFARRSPPRPAPHAWPFGGRRLPPLAGRGAARSLPPEPSPPAFAARSSGSRACSPLPPPVARQGPPPRGGMPVSASVEARPSALGHPCSFAAFLSPVLRVGGETPFATTCCPATLTCCPAMYCTGRGDRSCCQASTCRRDMFIAESTARSRRHRRSGSVAWQLRLTSHATLACWTRICVARTCSAGFWGAILARCSSMYSIAVVGSCPLTRAAISAYGEPPRRSRWSRLTCSSGRASAARSIFGSPV